METDWSPSRSAAEERSPALRRLRVGVTLCGFGVAAAAILQLLVFGFVHFTEVRFTNLEPIQERQSLSVVRSAPVRPDGGPSPRVETEPPPQISTVDVNRVRTGWDVGLERLSGLAVTTGVVSTLALSILAMLGVVVASTTQTPGVERAVSATTWAIVLAMVSLPLDNLVGSTPFAGVFGGYSKMIETSGMVNTGTGSAASLFASYLILPLVGIVAAALVVYQFRQGVEQGIVVQSLSEYDELVAEEIANIRKKGVGSNLGVASSRAASVGARTLPSRSSSEAVTQADKERQRRIGAPSPGDALQRPI